MPLILNIRLILVSKTKWILHFEYQKEIRQK